MFGLNRVFMAVAMSLQTKSLESDDTQDETTADYCVPLFITKWSIANDHLVKFGHDKSSYSWVIIIVLTFVFCACTDLTVSTNILKTSVFSHQSDPIPSCHFLGPCLLIYFPHSYFQSQLINTQLPTLFRFTWSNNHQFFLNHNFHTAKQKINPQKPRFTLSISCKRYDATKWAGDRKGADDMKYIIIW